MDVLKGFSERLIELMQENGLNAEKLSKKLGVAPTIIRRWCLPQKDIYYSNLLQVANYFNCSLDFLCGRSDVVLDFVPKECPPFMEWLPTVIKERGKSTYKIFKDTRIKSSYFAKWRKGREPLLSSLGILADYLDCSLDRLVGRDR
jgi:DNA-binding helix-turn-helix protein